MQTLQKKNSDRHSETEACECAKKLSNIRSRHAKEQARIEDVMKKQTITVLDLPKINTIKQLLL